jgi:hypothetical protein
MAGSKSNYLSLKVLDHVLGNTGYTAPATVYVGLWTTAGALTDAATGSTTAEVSTSGTAYARQSVTNNTTNWPNASGSTTGLKQNGTAITWTTATASWGTVNQFALLDASSAGNILFWGDLTSAKPIATGDTASFSAYALSITED